MLHKKFVSLLGGLDGENIYLFWFHEMASIECKVIRVVRLTTECT